MRDAQRSIVRCVQEQQDALAGLVFRRPKNDGRLISDASPELFEDYVIALKLTLENPGNPYLDIAVDGIEIEVLLSFDRHNVAQHYYPGACDKVRVRQQDSGGGHARSCQNEHSQKQNQSPDGRLRH